MLKDIMKTMNKLHRMHIESLNIDDVKNLFGTDFETIKKCFDYLEITYVKVADLFNVEVRYFSKDEQEKNMMYWNIING